METYNIFSSLEDINVCWESNTFALIMWINFPFCELLCFWWSYRSFGWQYSNTCFNSFGSSLAMEVSGIFVLNFHICCTTWFLQGGIHLISIMVHGVMAFFSHVCSISFGFSKSHVSLNFSMGCLWRNFSPYIHWFLFVDEEIVFLSSRNINHTSSLEKIETMYFWCEFLFSCSSWTLFHLQNYFPTGGGCFLWFLLVEGSGIFKEGHLIPRRYVTHGILWTFFRAWVWFWIPFGYYGGSPGASFHFIFDGVNVPTMCFTWL